ncbi:hypothetical protein BDY24DRAFT_378523 [Mrakia frigida]|uniref:uncharacterized protein n=1 Tax=Mrakia frigida TaxID=29902 RepID=UPI003FCBF524
MRWNKPTLPGPPTLLLLLFPLLLLHQPRSRIHHRRRDDDRQTRRRPPLGPRRRRRPPHPVSYVGRRSEGAVGGGGGGGGSNGGFERRDEDAVAVGEGRFQFERFSSGCYGSGGRDNVDGEGLSVVDFGSFLFRSSLLRRRRPTPTFPTPQPSKDLPLSRFVLPGCSVRREVGGGQLLHRHQNPVVLPLELLLRLGSPVDARTPAVVLRLCRRNRSKSGSSVEGVHRFLLLDRHRSRGSAVGFGLGGEEGGGGGGGRS